MWTFYKIIFKIYKAFKSFESAFDQIAEYTKSLHKILPKSFSLYVRTLSWDALQVFEIKAAFAGLRCLL